MDALPEAMGALSHFFASPFDNRQVEIRSSLESLQSFSYHHIVKNLQHSHSLLEEDENWDHSDIVRVPHVMNWNSLSRSTL
ncbi:UNVERIFIED_CONTAM: hypothetical protein NCL1_57291 [Trichonephila clavipes]